MTEKEKELVRVALKARELAYAPYSHHKVGAALLASDGTVFTGCNIENAAYGPTNCAERTALFKAVSEGVRSFTAIAIVGGLEEAETLPICAPCGVCRQALREFTDPKTFRVILGTDRPDIAEVYTLEELLPMSFGPENLNI